MAIAYIALGSNLGDSLSLVQSAERALEEGGVQLLARSPVFETDAVAEERQPAYLTALVRARTDLPPRATLELCLAAEAALGRVRLAGKTRAARPIDLDLLLHDDVVLD